MRRSVEMRQIVVEWTCLEQILRIGGNVIGRTRLNENAEVVRTVREGLKENGCCHGVLYDKEK